MKKYTSKELFEMDAVEVYKLVLKGDIKKFPNGFWMQPEAKQNAVKCVRFLIKDILCLSDDELKKQFSIKFLKEYKLNGMLTTCFNNSPYKVINAVYPNKFKSWEFKSAESGCWKDRAKSIEAIKWLIEEKLKLSDEELKEKLSKEMFKKNNLNGMLANYFNSSPYEAINAAYPNKFKPWEFQKVSINFWKDKKNVINATKWLIEEKLKFTDIQLKEKLSVELFVSNGLGSMLNSCYNGSPYEAINAAYPNKFKPWEFKNVSIGYWKDIENGVKATKWLIEEKLKLTDEELKEQLSKKLFSENGLNGMLRICFDYSPYEAINTAYPGKFKKEDFKNYR